MSDAAKPGSIADLTSRVEGWNWRSSDGQGHKLLVYLQSDISTLPVPNLGKGVAEGHNRFREQIAKRVPGVDFDVLCVPGLGIAIRVGDKNAKGEEAIRRGVGSPTAIAYPKPYYEDEKDLDRPVDGRKEKPRDFKK